MRCLLLFRLASCKLTAVCQVVSERDREIERESSKDREWERSGLGHYHPYYSSLKYAHHKDILLSVCVCVYMCLRACTHVTEYVHASAGPDVHMCVLMQKWQKKNNIIGEMYAVIIGIQKMIIHIKQGAQSQPHLHVLDYMHFKSNFRRAYEWH